MSKGYDLNDLYRVIPDPKPATRDESFATEKRTETATAHNVLPVATPSVQVCGKITRKATYELDADLLERVNRFAQQRSMKKLAVIERALRDYLAANDV